MRKFEVFALRAMFVTLSGGVIAAALFPTSQALAQSMLGLPAQSAVGAPQAVEGLPTPTGPGRPVRQLAQADCGPNPCRYTFLQVPANRLLEIDNLSCAASASTGAVRHFLVSNSSFINLTSIKAFILPRVLEDLGGGTTAVYAESSGPLFFQAGERIYLFGPGGGGGACSLSGRLFPTN